MTASKGHKLAIRMLKEIRAIGYKEFSLREYERRQEGQQPGAAQRDIVGDCVREAERSSDPAVLADFTSLVDPEIYDNMGRLFARMARCRDAPLQ